MPVNTCKRKPFGQKCRNQIIALVPLSKINKRFVLFILVLLQNHIFKSFLEKCNFCFPPYVCVWLFLFFSLLFSITSPPVQTLNPIGKNVPNLQFWVSLLLIETKWSEKAEDCLFDWFVSIFKFSFSINFTLHFLHQFGNKFLCKLIFLPLIWGSILCKKSFRARNCRDLQLCFTFLRIRFWFLKLSVFFSKQVVNRPFFLERYHKTDLWVGSSH